ncbi:MAG: hypothetical protein MJZ90_09010 [Bacteroidales bacterium]|nr:hypothetical protein [Bacteroidales bacterium]
MKKKNILLAVFAIILMVTATLFITSCDKSSGGSSGGSTSSNSIVGTWKGDIDDEVDVVLKVYNDNTGTVTLKDNYYNETVKYDLTYKMTDDDKGYAIVEFDSYYYGTEYQRVDFELNGKIMYVYSNDEYYGNELICVLHKQ